MPDAALTGSFFNWFFRTGRLQKHPCMGLRNFSAQEGGTI